MGEYIAHINETTGEIQTVKEHSVNTAELCGQYSIPELKDLLYDIGLWHDCGKYQPGFQKKIRGGGGRIEHSICGAKVAGEKYTGAAAAMMEYCIAGHHSGIPDGGFASDTPDLPTLRGRLKRKTEDFQEYEKELEGKEIDIGAFQKFLLRDCGGNAELLADKFTFFTRYCFSCLTDADSVDTAAFCRRDTDQPRPLKADFRACLDRIDRKLDSFEGKTGLQRARKALQEKVFRQSGENAEIYLMNMPTGSGKTLCGAKLAFERALRGKKKRIIYVIPYNSIIDQTADIFEELFDGCAEILRHQSTFSYEDSDKDHEEDYRLAARNAAENWDAPLILTTAVQFFETVYANRRGKLRKLHNLADSVLIFDEAHLMPPDYLQPCLRAIAYLTRYLGSEAIFMTATMPDFRNLMERYALPDSKIRDLVSADDPLSEEFQKCEYRYIGKIGKEELLERANRCPSSLIIVNTRRAARELFRQCSGRKFHLSTYMTAYDRRRTIRAIRQSLRELEEACPDGREAAPEKRVTIISTSLIEAGVDLDVHTVFRELSGLDNILQAGGRCNREGSREKAEAETVVFEYEDGKGTAPGDERANITRGLFREYPRISCSRSISEYYERLYSLKKEEIQEKAITRDCHDLWSVPFRTYAEQFELIDSRTVSLAVPRDEKSRKLIDALRWSGRTAVRELQNYTCSVYQRELDDLVRQHAAEDFGTGIYCLTNPDYYDEETGITFEATDYYL